MKKAYVLCAWIEWNVAQFLWLGLNVCLGIYLDFERLWLISNRRSTVDDDKYWSCCRPLFLTCLMKWLCLQNIGRWKLCNWSFCVQKLELYLKIRPLWIIPENRNRKRQGVGGCYSSLALSGIILDNKENCIVGFVAGGLAAQSAFRRLRALPLEGLP